MKFQIKPPKPDDCATHTCTRVDPLEGGKIFFAENPRGGALKIGQFFIALKRQSKNQPKILSKNPKIFLKNYIFCPNLYFLVDFTQNFSIFTTKIGYFTILVIKFKIWVPAAPKFSVGVVSFFWVLDLPRGG